MFSKTRKCQEYSLSFPLWAGTQPVWCGPPGSWNPSFSLCCLNKLRISYEFSPPASRFLQDFIWHPVVVTTAGKGPEGHQHVCDTLDFSSECGSIFQGQSGLHGRGLFTVWAGLEPISTTTLNVKTIKVLNGLMLTHLNEKLHSNQV